MISTKEFVPGFKGMTVTPEQAEQACDVIDKIISRGSIYKSENPTLEQVQQYRRIVTRFNCMQRLPIHDDRDEFLARVKQARDLKRQNQYYERITQFRCKEGIKEASPGNRDVVVESYMIITDPFDGVSYSVMNIGKEFMDSSQRIKRMCYTDTQVIYKHKDPQVRSRAKALNEKSTIY